LTSWAECIGFTLANEYPSGVQRRSVTQ